MTNPTAPGLLQQMRAAPIAAVKPSGEEVDFTQVVTTPPVRSELSPWSGVLRTPPPAEPQAATPEAPVTGVPLPLVIMGLFGVLTLGGVIVAAIAVVRIV
jgi:hypothetical protein